MNHMNCSDISLCVCVCMCQVLRCHAASGKWFGVDRAWFSSDRLLLAWYRHCYTGLVIGRDFEGITSRDVSIDRVTVDSRVCSASAAHYLNAVCPDVVTVIMSCKSHN